MSGKPWFRERPEYFREVRAIADELQPELFWVVDGDVAHLRGTYLIVHDGEVLDRYEIDIEFPHRYPDAIPTVWETGGKIPKEADRHINRSGTACLFIEDEYWWRYPDGLSFREFLEEALKSFLLSQTYFDECEREWLFGEREHNAVGVWRFYSEVLGTEDLEVIMEYLDYIKRDAKGHWDCPCGSGDKLRDCHWDLVLDLKQRIPAEAAARSRRRIIKAIARMMAARERKETG